MNGNGNKVVLMAIAVVAVGIFALPGTVSLFSGQHTWYDISGDDKLPCVKCHADIQDEYLMTGVHAMLGGSGSSNASGAANITRPNDACYACHRVAYGPKPAGRGNMVYASGYGDGATPGEEAHAASTVACMACHEFSPSFDFTEYGAFEAGGFSDPYDGLGIPGDPVTDFRFNYNNSENPGGYAAHQGFIEGAINNTRMEDANEACIACHTAIPVKIKWTHAYSLEFDATYNASLTLPPTHFDTSNYTANGTAIRYSYGNEAGDASTDGFL